MTGNKIGDFITLSKSPNQNQDDFQEVIDNLKMKLQTVLQYKIHC